MDPRFLPKTLQAKLGWLVEECGEVQAALGKTLRHGILSTNPLLPPEKQETNGAWVMRELADLRHAIDMVERDLRDRLYNGPSAIVDLPPIDPVEAVIQNWRLKMVLLTELPDARRRIQEIEEASSRTGEPTA